MTPIFNWNCKELFLYLVAEYETSKNKLNQVVLWDKIIERGDNAIVNVNHKPNKYYFFDDGDELRWVVDLRFSFKNNFRTCTTNYFTPEKNCLNRILLKNIDKC